MQGPFIKRLRLAEVLICFGSLLHVLQQPPQSGIGARRLFREAPDTNLDGYNFWLDKLNGFGGDYRRAELVKAFLAATEYRRWLAQN